MLQRYNFLPISANIYGTGTKSWFLPQTINNLLRKRNNIKVVESDHFFYSHALANKIIAADSENMRIFAARNK